MYIYVYIFLQTSLLIYTLYIYIYSVDKYTVIYLYLVRGISCLSPESLVRQRLRPDFPLARRVAGIRWTATKPGTAADKIHEFHGAFNAKSPKTMWAGEPTSKMAHITP